MELTPRKEKVLSSVINGYVKTGEPVGSKTIAEEIGVSSATVRNEMADLTELGYLEQPHTSAGRVPSQKGYREYVDNLLDVPSLTEDEKRYLDSSLLSNAYDPERLLAGAARVLSACTRYCGVATTPSGSTATVKAVQFVQTSRRTAMIILISSAGTMKNRIFHCDFDLTNEIMRVFFRVFNEKISGKAVADLTPAFLQSMAASMGQLSILVGSPMLALLDVAADTMKTEVFRSGEMNLLFFPELETGARGMMDLLQQDRELAELLVGKPGKVTLLIGKEMGQPELMQTSLAVARYSIEGQDAGALALLGPVRMDYGKILALMQYVRERVSVTLTALMKEE